MIPMNDKKSGSRTELGKNSERSDRASETTKRGGSNSTRSYGTQPPPAPPKTGRKK